MKKTRKRKHDGAVAKGRQAEEVDVMDVVYFSAACLQDYCSYVVFSSRSRVFG